LVYHIKDFTVAKLSPNSYIDLTFESHLSRAKLLTGKKKGRLSLRDIEGYLAAKAKYEALVDHNCENDPERIVYLAEVLFLARNGSPTPGNYS
jgi:hypothetical protein